MTRWVDPSQMRPSSSMLMPSRRGDFTGNGTTWSSGEAAPVTPSAAKSSAIRPNVPRGAPFIGTIVQPWPPRPNRPRLLAPDFHLDLHGGRVAVVVLRQVDEAAADEVVVRPLPHQPDHEPHRDDARPVLHGVGGGVVLRHVHHAIF